jgi:hypothetical protein
MTTPAQWSQPPTPRPRRRGWDATWRVGLLVAAAIAAGWLLDAVFNLL